MTADVASAARQAIADIRCRFGPWATEEGLNGVFRAGPLPKKGKLFHDAWVFSGLSDAEIDRMDEEVALSIKPVGRPPRRMTGEGRTSCPEDGLIGCAEGATVERFP